MKLSSLLFTLLLTTMSNFAEDKLPLHPKYPVVEGDQNLTSDWALTLDQKHNRRVDEGSLVIWRPGFTIWMDVWNLNDGEAPLERLVSLEETMSPDAKNIELKKTGTPLQLNYTLVEGESDNPQTAVYSYTVGPSCHLQMAIYYNNKQDLDTAMKIIRSIKLRN